MYMHNGMPLGGGELLCRHREFLPQAAPKLNLHMPCQVERLSMMTELTPDRIMEAEQSLRLDVINSTVNIDMRLARLYDLLENDLLGALTLVSHYIAPYKVRRSPAAARVCAVAGPPEPPLPRLQRQVKGARLHVRCPQCLKLEKSLLIVAFAWLTADESSRPHPCLVGSHRRLYSSVHFLPYSPT